MNVSLPSFCGAVAVLLFSVLNASAQTPVVGEAAPDFTLQRLDDTSVSLSQLTAQGPVVLLALRGWPGYQCPICSRQVHDYVKHAADFKQRGAKVLMVYPGPADDLKAHAKEFLQDKSWPDDFVFVVDPNYTFTEGYGLRWKAEKETAYPSTFVLAKGGKTIFAEVSHTHGGRVSAEKALQTLATLAKP